MYMKQPEGFIQPRFEDHVCKLIHMIGMKLLRILTTNTTSRADPCVRYKKNHDGYTLTDMYMDNFLESRRWMKKLSEGNMKWERNGR